MIIDWVCTNEILAIPEMYSRSIQFGFGKKTTGFHFSHNATLRVPQPKFEFGYPTRLSCTRLPATALIRDTFVHVEWISVRLIFFIDPAYLLCTGTSIPVYMCFFFRDLFIIGETPIRAMGSDIYIILNETKMCDIHRLSQKLQEI